MHFPIPLKVYVIYHRNEIIIMYHVHASMILDYFKFVSINYLL